MQIAIEFGGRRMERSFVQERGVGKSFLAEPGQVRDPVEVEFDGAVSPNPDVIESAGVSQVDRLLKPATEAGDGTSDGKLILDDR